MTPQPATKEENRLHFSAIQSSVDFMALSERQQIFLTKYVCDGMTSGQYDPAPAVLAAYHPKDKRTAAVMGWQLLHKPRIKKVLDLHFKRSPMDGILADLQTAIRKSLKKGTPTIATQRAIEFCEKQMRQFQQNTEPEPAGVQKFAVGETVEQSGRRYKIVAEEIE